MGVYDTINFKCPECCNIVEIQTKVIPSSMHEYDESNVPDVLAEAIKGNTEYCPHCGDRFVIMPDPTVTGTTGLFLRKVF